MVRAVERDERDVLGRQAIPNLLVHRRACVDLPARLGVSSIHVRPRSAFRTIARSVLILGMFSGTRAHAYVWVSRGFY